MKLSSLINKPQEVEIGGEKHPLYFCNAALGYMEDYYEGKADKLVNRYVPELHDPAIKQAKKKEIEALKARKFIDGVALAHMFVNAGTKVDFAVTDLITLVFAGLIHIDDGKKFTDREKFTEQIGRITNDRKQVLQLTVLIGLSQVLMTDEQAERFDVLEAKAEGEGKNGERPDGGETSIGDSTGHSAE